MSNHPQADDSRPDRDPDPAAPPPSAPDGTHQVSGQPWSTPSGDLPAADPFQPPRPYQPGPQAYQPPPPEYPPTSQFPPVNYAPPGYPPDYGGGYPPPPGYPAVQPDRPPRKSNAPLIAVILAVSLLLCGGVATASVLIFRAAADRAEEAIEPITELPTIDPELPELPGLPTDLPTAVPGTGRKLTVTYEVTGDGPAQILYVEKLGGAQTRLDNVKLPWKFSAEVETPALLSVIAMRIDTTDGEISCRALVDGEEVKQRTSGSGTFATASCTHFALD